MLAIAARLARPREVARTGDDSPAAGVWRYVWRMTGRSQLLACALAIVATALSLAPVELQRRMFDDALSSQDFEMLLALAAIYLASVLALQAVKFVIGLLTGWMSESAVVYTRAHLWTFKARRRDPGVSSILLTETDALGGFTGAAPSQFVANLSLLIGALAYMFWVEPLVAAAGLAMVAPQAVLAPIIQKRLNRYVSTRVRLLRRYAASLERDPAPEAGETAARLRSLHRARMAFLWWKFLMKAALNVLNAAAPLAVIVAGGWLAIAGDSSIGVIVAFVAGFARIGDPIRQLIGFYRETQEARVRHDLIADWMRQSS